MNSKYETEKAAWLERLTWCEAESRLREDRVIVIPLGAAAKEHGPHLPLNNDALIAEWLAREVAQQMPVVVAPLVNVSYYPAFVDYPGSITLSVDTARDLIIEICMSLAQHGGKRFYVLNTGVSTEGPLAEAQLKLREQDIEFQYLQLDNALERLPPGLLEQEWGSHADEHETSLMLYLAPDVVDMQRAVDDGNEGKGRLSRTRDGGIYSASGIYGQATLATATKGKVVAEILLEQVLADIESM